jgi:hypothetical protein
MTEEMRGQWPGGWKENPTTGHLMLAIRESGHHQGEEAPVWACHLCQHGSLHTLQEHRLLTGEKE